MSSISEQLSIPVRTKTRPRDARSRRHARAADIHIMGPANRAPGTPIMGTPSRTPDVMGAVDAGPRVSVMGPGDRGPRLDVFGKSDLRFVDSLFTTLTIKEQKP